MAVGLSRLKMKDLPLSERPYEKMEQYGPDTLSNAELLAIIIRTGNRSETVVSLAQRILKHGEGACGFNFLREAALEELQAIPGIGKVKAVQLKALMEIAKRIASNSGRKKSTPLTSPEDVSRLVMEEMRYLRKEVFKAVFLNTKNHVLKVMDISVGSLNSSIVHPREVFSEAVKTGCAGVILIHNHPSGEPEPSREDVETTVRLVSAGNILGIKVFDHIVIGDGRYISMKEKGFM